MKTGASFLGFICLASGSTVALAASATPEEAQRLTGVFQTYLGNEPGVVTVAVAGEAYDVKIDLASLISKFKQPNFSAEISPIIMTLADQGGGKWLVTQDSPLSYTAKIPGQLEMTVKVGTLKGSSLFDGSTSTFVTSTFDMADLSVDETVTPPEGASMHVAYNIGAMHYETTTTPSSTGALDSAFHIAMSGITETIGIPATPTGGASTDIKVTVETGTQDGTITGARVQAIYKLIAWFVAHPSEEAIKANQAELKTIVRDGLPLFENITSTGTLQNLIVTTPIGPIGIAKLGFDIGANGIVADGMLHEGFSAEGLTLPPGPVPPFATDLVPHSFSFDFKIADFNLTDSAKMFLEGMDLTKEKLTTPEQDLKLLTALLPKGAATFSIAPGKVSAKLYDIGFEGSMTAGPNGMPLGSATVTARGLDDVMKTLQAGPPEMVGQAIPGIIAAKGMAKTEADGSLTWKIENTISGTVLINGIDISKMGGG